MLITAKVISLVTKLRSTKYLSFLIEIASTDPHFGLVCHSTPVSSHRECLMLWLALYNFTTPHARIAVIGCGCCGYPALRQIISSFQIDFREFFQLDVCIYIYTRL